MRSPAKSVDDYLEALPPERRRPLARLRTLIQRAAPTAKESMKHGMPTYERDGSMLFAFAAQKQYLALYVANTALVEAHRAKLGNVAIGKSCIRFRTAKDLAFPSAAKLLEEAAGTFRS